MSSPPAWTIGTSKRSIDMKPPTHTIPGPGSYHSDIKKGQNAPHWRIGTAPRSVEKRSETPGPGNYDPEKTLRSVPKFSMGIKPVASDRSQTPGPGAYDSTKLRARDARPPAFSMRGRSMDLDRKIETTPGPGAYEQGSKIRNQNPPTVRIGNAKRELSATFYTPGPGAYSSVVEESENKEGPKWVFGTAERNTMNMTYQSLPGPGAYNLNNSFEGNKRGPILVSRKPDSALMTASRLPGPGAYNPPIITKRAPTYRVGSAPRSRDSKEQKEVPGPGNYEPKLVDQSHGVIIGRSTRRPLAERTSSPGPGAYDYNLTTNHGPKYVIVPRRGSAMEVQKDKYTPGPGAYEPSLDSVKQRNPKFGVGSATRESFYKSERIPGPGAYNTRGGIQGPKWCFGSERRRSAQIPTEPGPGSYNVPCKFADVPRYSLGESKMKITL